MDAQLRLPLASLKAADVPARPGVYALYRDDDRRIHLGSTDCLQERIWGTTSAGADGDLGTEVAALRRSFGGCAIAWLECESEAAARRREAELKAEFAPGGRV